MRPVFCLLFVTFLFGCPRSEVARRTTAFQESTLLVSESLFTATTDANALDAYRVKVRYNPAACKCPPFEVFAYGRWTRTTFVGEGAVLRAVLAFGDQEQRSPSLRTIEVRGAFGDELATAENQVRYPVFLLAEP